MVRILKTERMVVRELDSASDAEFVLELLNTPGFLKYIGDRGVRTPGEARDFIENRYRRSYREHGYGLYAVEVINENVTAGMCGFVRREGLSCPDLGFAFLPQYEKRGYAFESSVAVMEHGRRFFGFDEVLAITTQDNGGSQRLLNELGFVFKELYETPDGEVLNLYASDGSRGARDTVRADLVTHPHEIRTHRR